MATARKMVFRNDSFYHIFNRGMDKRETFLNKREFFRAVELLSFYKYKSIPVRFSLYHNSPIKKQNEYMDLMIKSGTLVDIVAYCLMPNHFHLLLKQKVDRGVTIFVSNFINAYTRYFNMKHERIGALFQGVFKAVYIESDEQLLHVSRYIHLNPLMASIVDDYSLETYQWSSYPAYLHKNKSTFVDNEIVLNFFASSKSYKSFVIDQIDYAKKLAEIKHVTLE